MHTFVDVKFTSIVHEHQQERKFLGKIIYENLSWKSRITSICDKVAKVIGILSNSRRYLPSVTLKTLYYSFFLPYINYCNLMWAATYASYLEPLYLLQKKAIRIITFSFPWTGSKPLLSKLNIFCLHSLYKFHVSSFVFSHLNRLLSASLSSLFHFNRDFQGYLTRSRFNLHKMSVRYQFAISSQALIIWTISPWLSLTALPLLTLKRN